MSVLLLAFLASWTIGFTYVSSNKADKKDAEINKCIEQLTDLYGDLCAESSSGYERMSGRDAHYEGVVCAAEYMQICKGE